MYTLYSYKKGCENMSSINSDVYLFKNIPLDNTYNNLVTNSFGIDTLTSSYGYAHFSNQMWCRIVGQFDNKVRLDTGGAYQADAYMNYNYIAVNNIEGHTIFGFITNILYVNDRVMEVTFEIDCYHTYKLYNYFSFLPSLIERATPDKDWGETHFTLPDFTLDGAYDTIASTTWNGFGQSLYLAMFFAPPKGKTYAETETPITSTGQMSGILQGCHVTAEIAYPASEGDPQRLRNTLNILYRKGFECVYATLIPADIYNTYNNIFSKTYDLDGTNVWNSRTTEKNGFINGYKYKNNKMLTSPYCCLEVTNNVGTVKRYAWEGWGTNSPEFELRAVSVPSPTIILIPKNYYGKDYDFENAIPYANFPNMPVQADTIATWIAQNQTSQTISTLSSGLTGAVFGATSAGPVGALIGGGLGLFTGAMSAVGQYDKASNSPTNMTSSGGNTSVLPLLGLGKMGYTFRSIALRPENLQGIDSYFTRFGCAEYKVGNPPTGRSVRGKYIYVKTQGCSVKSNNGGMPVWALRKICEILDRGVTFWSSVTDVGNYS